MKLGTTIKQLRKRSKLSQIKMSEETGISQSFLSQIETNKREPHVSSIKKICKVLGIPVAVLFFISTDETDIPEHKRKIFNTLFPCIKKAYIELFSTK